MFKITFISFIVINNFDVFKMEFLKYLKKDQIFF